MNKFSSYVAGNLLLTARALIGYVEVTLQLTMKLFLAKISSGQHCKEDLFSSDFHK